MMRKFFFLSWFIPVFSFATGVTVIQKDNQWQLIYTSSTGQTFLVNNYKLQVSPISGQGDVLYSTRGHIFSILYDCDNDPSNSCLRYIDLQTNEMSHVIVNPALMIDKNQNTLGPIDNLKQNVVLTFNYPQDIQYTITPIFQNCVHPFVYKLKEASTGPNFGSKFLDNGNLKLNMIMAPSASVPYQSVVIPIDYKKLDENCQSNS